MTHIPAIKYIVSLLIIIPFVQCIYSQTAIDSIVVEDTLGVPYERVLLDGEVAYRNETTNEIISKSVYLKLGGSDTLPQDKFIRLDNWDTNVFNPYKGVKLTPPFKIKFDQTTFTHPIAIDLVVTSRFGRRRRGPHGGVDLDLITGDDVRSVLPGKVRYVGYSRGHGKTVVVRHANDIETVYAHLSAYSVEVNDVVREGQVLGKGGNTGNSRGSHLHLEVRYKGTRIHPEYIFNFDGSQTIRGKELWVSNEWRSPRMHSSYRQSKLVPLYTKEEALIAQKNEPRYHRVRKGETLSYIAVRHGLRLRDIYRLNRVSKNSILRIGQTIRVR